VELKLVERNDDITQVTLAGRLDVTGVHGVDIKFHAATAAQGRPAIIDLTELVFIASLGIGMLFACARSLHSKGKKMALVSPGGPVTDTLRTAHVEDFVAIAGSVEEAEALLG
jgi:anti-anti-sigma factor